MTEQMKPSGIEWIGDIPASWKCSKVKFCFSLVNGSTPESGDYDCWDGDIKWITPADMSDTGTISHGERFITKYGYNSCGTTLLPVGSIIISSRAPIGKINIATAELCTNQGCKSLIRYADNRYFYYLLLAGQNELSLLGRGTTFLELSTYDLNGFGLVIPAEDEQKAIADFLDKECAQIDSIAADLEKQIELLQQYKKSLITEAVTKGLGKSVPMKDSGVEWLGKIPEHWDVEPIKYRVTFHNGDRGKNYPSKSELQSEGIPFINAGHLEGDGLNMDNMDYISEEKYRIMGGVKLRAGDILYCLRGSVGKNAIVDMNQGTVASSLVAIRSVRILAEYLYYCLNSHIEEVQRYLWDNGTAQPNLSADNLGKYKICIPPVEEQMTIVEYLNNICSQIDNLIIGKRKQLSTIQQHKKSLIYEYVTGKKRVKEVR